MHVYYVKFLAHKSKWTIYEPRNIQMKVDCWLYKLKVLFHSHVKYMLKQYRRGISVQEISEVSPVATLGSSPLLESPTLYSLDSGLSWFCLFLYDPSLSVSYLVTFQISVNLLLMFNSVFFFQLFLGNLIMLGFNNNSKVNDPKTFSPSQASSEKI